MHSHQTFVNPPALPHPVVVDALERGIRDRAAEAPAADALVGIALNDDDREFIESCCCLEVGTRAGTGNPLLGLAGLCLGHAARRFGRLSDQAIAMVESLARAEADPSDVDGRALDGRDDVRWYLRENAS